MTMLEVCNWLQDSTLGLAIRKADSWVGAVLQIFHVSGFLLLLAAIVLLNLRLLGASLRLQSIVQVGRAALPVFYAGLLLTIGSGGLIFISGAVHYYPNEAFWYKMMLLLIAIIFQFLIISRIRYLQDSQPILLKVISLFSLILWFSVGIAGRTIGFI